MLSLFSSLHEIFTAFPNLYVRVARIPSPLISEETFLEQASPCLTKTQFWFLSTGNLLGISVPQALDE